MTLPSLPNASISAKSLDGLPRVLFRPPWYLLLPAIAIHQNLSHFDSGLLISRGLDIVVACGLMLYVYLDVVPLPEDGCTCSF